MMGRTNRHKHTFVGTVLVSALVASCGGGGGGSTVAPPKRCDLVTHKNWLRSYMQESYFWAGKSPNPDPESYATLQEYFDAQLFTGSAPIPKDRWSYISDTASYNQFFEQGKTLGFGLAVNGLEGKLPLKIRYVEPNSPAAIAGLARGDVIKSINGVSDQALFSKNDFSALSPAIAGDTVSIQIESGADTKAVQLVATTYSLQPVSVSKVLSLPDGNKAGYIVLKDFISQSEAPLTAAIEDFRVSGVKEIIIDLRYNGGGLVSTATVLASLLAGRPNTGKLFVRLNYSAKQASQNSAYNFNSTSNGFGRVVILTGPRTCSASELVANGLRPYLEVITVGAQTCGKPFGFSPVENCGKTVSAVNFEALNAKEEGRYYDGIAPTCQATDDFSGQLGDSKEILIAAATAYLQTGQCMASPVLSTANTTNTNSIGAASRRSYKTIEPDEFKGMRSD